MNIVYIKWIDTIVDSDVGWKSDEDTDDFFSRDDNVAEDVGFVWSEDKDFIHLIGGMINGDIPLTHHRSKIPKKWILERKVLMKIEHKR